ncbi:tctex1 domain-containing protein 1-like isoform X2 [Mizuhopecten yessoensis]|uniref:tctex1 domain-containing protein 1-like isoform X2 n=1 Tax=Mizuhopecten yessoensis TaxID=6573 RepID=UPI000B45E567|nr:tctex1 domain-containing protein 1-like isoform X2 [Mizuhopecten yessoensis]
MEGTTPYETRVAESSKGNQATSFFKTALEYEDYKNESLGSSSDPNKPTKRQPDSKKATKKQSDSSTDSKKQTIMQPDSSEPNAQTILTRMTAHLHVQSPILASVVNTGEKKASSTHGTPPSNKMLSLLRREKSTTSQEGDTGAGNMMQLIKLRNIARNVKNIQHDRQKRLENTGNETIYIKFRKFDHKEAEESMKDALKSGLQHVVYEPKRCKSLSLQLSDRIRNSMKRLQFPRYKFVSFVTIGQKGTQDVVIASRCVWNTDDDNYASVRFENKTLFATAVVFALLQE